MNVVTIDGHKHVFDPPDRVEFDEHVLQVWKGKVTYTFPLVSVVWFVMDALP